MTPQPLKILSLSDILVSFIYSPQVKQRFDDVDLVLGCGDLAYYYLEYVLTSLNAPCFFVRGNHDKVVEYSLEGQRTAPAGAFNLHRQVVECRGWLLAGVEGSLRYRYGPYQYSHREMWFHVFQLLPKLLANRIRYGRFLDIFVSHSPPAGVHDLPDLPHQGIKAFHWLDRVFKPAYHIHGHVHLYRPDSVNSSLIGRTEVINTYPYRSNTYRLEQPPRGG